MFLITTEIFSRKELRKFLLFYGDIINNKVILGYKNSVFFRGNRNGSFFMQSSWEKLFLLHVLQRKNRSMHESFIQSDYNFFITRGLIFKFVNI